MIDLLTFPVLAQVSDMVIRAGIFLGTPKKGILQIHGSAVVLNIVCVHGCFLGAPSNWNLSTFVFLPLIETQSSKNLDLSVKFSLSLPRKSRKKGTTRFNADTEKNVNIIRR